LFVADLLARNDFSNARTPRAIVFAGLDPCTTRANVHALGIGSVTGRGLFGGTEIAAFWIAQIDTAITIIVDSVETTGFCVLME
jgi:hypothetical protein